LGFFIWLTINKDWRNQPISIKDFVVEVRTMNPTMLPIMTFAVLFCGVVTGVADQKCGKDFHSDLNPVKIQIA